MYALNLSIIFKNPFRNGKCVLQVSDVEQGGATVFVDLGLTLSPKKGSAVFWYNLFKNGEGDVRTRHAACPVLAGTKWGKFKKI